MPDLRDLANELRELEALTGLCEEDAERLGVLRALQDQLFTATLTEYAENEPTLIRESEFEEYAQDFAEGCGYVDGDSAMAMYIDWARWANDMKMDYQEVEFDGDTYLIRAY